MLFARDLEISLRNVCIFFRHYLSRKMCRFPAPPAISLSQYLVPRIPRLWAFREITPSCMYLPQCSSSSLMRSSLQYASFFSLKKSDIGLKLRDATTLNVDLADPASCSIMVNQVPGTNGARVYLEISASNPKEELNENF